MSRWFGESPRAQDGQAEEGLSEKEEEGKKSRADELLADLAFSLDPEQMAAFELAAGCARYFDVEDALVRGDRRGEHPRAAARAQARAVPHAEDALRDDGQPPRGA